MVLPARGLPREADLVRGVRVRRGRLLHCEWLRKSAHFSGETGRKLRLRFQAKSRELALVRGNKITGADCGGSADPVQALPANLERQAKGSVQGEAHEAGHAFGASPAGFGSAKR